MIKLLSVMICLAITACGQSTVNKTASVANSGYVLGLVPLRGGATAKDQRYRLLVCKRLPLYSEAMLADQSLCRSALLTEDGQEVDLVGDKLDAAHKDSIPHLQTEFASEAREFGSSPLSEKQSKSAVLPGAIGLALGGVGVLQIKYGDILDDFFWLETPSEFTKLLRVVNIGLGVVIIGSGALMVVGAIGLAKKAAQRNQRRERIGDDEGRNYPKTDLGGLSDSTEYLTQTELVAHRQWHNIAKAGFRNITRLEYEDNLHAILKAMAKFYKLKVNEAALDF